jgi:hypothetical protein
MAKTLFVLNDQPYGSERSYNALRLAGALSKREGEHVRRAWARTKPTPVVTLHQPSWRWHASKVPFEKSWLYLKL